MHTAGRKKFNWASPPKFEGFFVFSRLKAVDRIIDIHALSAAGVTLRVGRNDVQGHEHPVKIFSSSCLKSNSRIFAFAGEFQLRTWWGYLRQVVGASNRVMSRRYRDRQDYFTMRIDLSNHIHTLLQMRDLRRIYVLIKG